MGQVGEEKYGRVYNGYRIEESIVDRVRIEKEREIERENNNDACNIDSDR